MSDPMRIRLQLQDSAVLVRVLMSHEMETGLRKDADGKLVPAWHITQVVVALNGKTVLSAQWGTAIAKNPFTQFVVKSAKSGDKITISWVDNHGDKRSDEAVVA
jgi:sulfur-oxidizing protein SoxZ